MVHKYVEETIKLLNGILRVCVIVKHVVNSNICDSGFCEDTETMFIVCSCDDDLKKFEKFIPLFSFNSSVIPNFEFKQQTG